jgi:hypothetical protein
MEISGNGTRFGFGPTWLCLNPDLAWVWVLDFILA